MMPCQPMMVMGPERVLRVAMSDTYTALTWCSTPTTKWGVAWDIILVTTKWEGRYGTPYQLLLNEEVGVGHHVSYY